PVHRRSFVVHKERPVCISIESYAKIGTLADDLSLKALCVHCPATEVDITAVGRAVDRLDLGAQPLKQPGSERTGCSISTVHDDLHTTQSAWQRGGQKSKVLLVKGAVRFKPCFGRTLAAF